MKVLAMIGTRPEAVKMAPVIQELKRHPESIEVAVCVTGQHRQLLDQVLPLFGIVPDYDLDLMTAAQTPGQLLARICAELTPLLAQLQPDWVLVQGDTTTVLAAALVAAYAAVNVGHIEAGLRTYDNCAPFPEEINRRVVSSLADLHFAPTRQDRCNLLRENIASQRIVVTGNPVVDALQQMLTVPHPALDELCQIPKDKRILLVTAHRRENWGAPLVSICHAVKTIAERFADRVHIVFPVHPNPAVQKTVYPILAQCAGISLLPPLSYLSLIHLLQASYFVLTDSGGLQEEAATFKKPILVLRDKTERTAGVTAGIATLVGTDHKAIVKTAASLLDDAAHYAQMTSVGDLYGDGHAAEQIVAALLRYDGARHRTSSNSSR